jgi:hypothetical protein
LLLLFRSFLVEPFRLLFKPLPPGPFDFIHFRSLNTNFPVR